MYVWMRTHTYTYAYMHTCIGTHKQMNYAHVHTCKCAYVYVCISHEREFKHEYESHAFLPSTSSPLCYTPSADIRQLYIRIFVWLCGQRGGTEEQVLVEALQRDLGPRGGGGSEHPLQAQLLSATKTIHFVDHLPRGRGACSDESVCIRYEREPPQARKISVAGIKVKVKVKVKVKSKSN